MPDNVQESKTQTIEEQRAEIERLKARLEFFERGRQIVTLPNGDIYLLNAEERPDTVKVQPGMRQPVDRQAIAAQVARAMRDGNAPVDLPTRQYAQDILNEAVAAVEQEG